MLIAENIGHVKAISAYMDRDLTPRIGDAWRINFSRVEWQITRTNNKYQKLPNTKEDNWVWSPQGVIDMHQPEHWGFVEFAR